MRLPRAQALAGRVTDERGGPVVGATVTLWPGRARGLLSCRTPRASRRRPRRRPTAASASTPRPRTATDCGSRRPRSRRSSGGRAGGRPRAAGRARGRPGPARHRDAPDQRTPASGALVRFEGRTQTTRWVETRPDGTFLLDGAPREAGSLVADGGDRGRASAPVGAAGARARRDRARRRRRRSPGASSSRRRRADRRRAARGARAGRRLVPHPLGSGRPLLAAGPAAAVVPAHRRGRPLRDRGRAP